MMKLKAFRSLFVVFFFTLFAQAQFTLSGVVADDAGNPVSNAEVYLVELEVLTKTSTSGRFYFEDVSAGTYRLIVFVFGYRTFEQTVALESNQELSVSLEPLGEQLSEVVLTQEREKIFGLQQLKKVEGTAIYAGKKSEVVLLDNITGNLAANNPRQIYSQVVGLNIYENGDAGLQLNVGGRGLDPNRTANFNVRQNGYDISADALGYPESYYTPPAEALQEIQVVRGAASLQYGPQFGGLINFKFKKPNPNKKIEWVSRQTLGSFDLRTSFNSLSGTIGKFSYYTYFNYKEGNGFRPNSSFDSRNYFGHFGYQLTEKTKLTFEATLFNYLAQQPGGLTDLQFNADPTFSNRPRNWFDVDWKLFSLRLDHRFSSKTDFSLNLFTLDASRSAIGLRTNRVDLVDDPTEPRELLIDNFQNWGTEARLLTRYQIKDQDAVLLLGSKYYQSDNNQLQGPGSAEGNADFVLRDDEFPNFLNQAQFTFPNLNLALFGENIFNLSKTFSITPGFRFEYIKTESSGSFREIVLDLAGNPLSNEEIPESRNFERGFVILGVGISYKPNPGFEIYANFSQNYRSVTFNDIRITNDSQRIDEDITDETGFTADLGIRGRLDNLLSYDASVFALLYDNRIGETVDPEDGVGTLRGNIGTAFIYGFEGFGDLNLKELWAPGLEKLKLNVFANLAVTDSEYTESDQNNVEGNKVEFIPNINLKSGLNFGYGNLLGSVQYTFIDEQFTDATNSPPLFEDARNAGIIGSIPSYDIIDISLSYTYKKFRLEAGINNVLDNSYFTRRATGYPGPGIIPAEPRTFYTTLQVKL
ncbi:TonB-dependent receptor domain-containing protein [Flagellimonas sp.]|uniref:TonB-dependent receptor domain-containing protein n=1 Tax=Flagellimonas sp. TaxID=2058762 RepID=UPI003F49BD40